MSEENDVAFYNWLITNYGFPTNIGWDRVPQAIRKKREEYDKMQDDDPTEPDSSLRRIMRERKISH